MKKIAIVTNSSWNILNFRRSLIEELSKYYKIVLVTPKDEFSQEIMQLAPTVFLKNLERKGKNPIQDLMLINELYRIYKTEAIDLVLHFTIKPNIYGSIAANLCNIPSMAVVTGLGYTFLNKGLSSKIAKKLYKFSFSKNSLTVFQNNDDRELFLSNRLVSKKKSTVIYGSGIDMKVFSPKAKDDWFSGFSFIFLGRLLQDKGVNELLAAFSDLFSSNNNVYLHIIGEVDPDNPSSISQNDLFAFVKENKNISLHGHIDKPQEFIANCDCLVLPSYREGLPRANLEALAMAKPIITTNVAGCKETVIHGYNGLLCKAKDSLDLGIQMKAMVNFSIEKRAEMGHNGLLLARERFDSKIINQEYRNEIDKILSAK